MSIRRSNFPQALFALGCVVCVAPRSQAQAPAEEEAAPAFKQEELNQILAPVALYPDSLLSQVFMAATYPLEVVQAARWAEENKNLKGDAQTTQLEKQDWDPSVKSLVNFPEVLAMMNEKLDWTMKLGDAFIADQKQVMDTVQKLRAKAKTEGNLETTKEQKVVVEPQGESQIIVIESSQPDVIYVPTYSPTVVYGTWPYPAYPPYSYYPPGYVAGTAALSFGLGVACGAAWGYAWGNCNWHGGDIDIDCGRNLNFNGNINRNSYQNNLQRNNASFKGSRGSWQHDGAHRKGAPYRDSATSQRFGGAGNRQASAARESFRGRAETGRQDIARGGADQFKGSSGGARAGQTGRDASRGTGGAQAGRDRSPAASNRSGSASRDGGGSQRSSALDGAGQSGRTTREQSSRGQSSRQSSAKSSGGKSRSSGGASRSGGGGSRGGGGRGGGGGRR